MKTKLTIAQFELIKAIPSIVESKDEKKKIKFALLELVQGALEDKWYNLKKETQQALQYACMRSAEQGFFFFAPKHLQDKFGISRTTVYETLRQLQDSDVLFKVHRTATTHNGNGNAVYAFTAHPNFQTFCELSGVNWKADCTADRKAENAENPTLPKAESDEKIPTLSLPSSLQKTLRDKDVKPYNVNDIENNTQSDSLTILENKIKEFENSVTNDKNMEMTETKKPQWHKYVPKAINEKFGYFGSILTDLWRKIKLAERKINDNMLEDYEKMSVAVTVLENLRKHPKFKSMSLDDMCAYVYKGQLQGLYNHIANDYLVRMNGNAYEDTYGNYIPTITPFGSLELYTMTQLMFGQMKEGSYPEIQSMLDEGEIEVGTEYIPYDRGFTVSMDSFCDILSESIV